MSAKVYSLESELFLKVYRYEISFLRVIRRR